MEAMHVPALFFMWSLVSAPPAVCPMLCQGNGVYVRGECQCYPGWKGKECDVPEDECEVPTCHGNGKCINGQCICSPGYGGKHCKQGRSRVVYICVHAYGTCTGVVV